jgi:hypothetical protein
MASAELLVSRTDISKTDFRATCPETSKPLEAGEIRFEIERFAFTANNITYAAFGDAMKYWNFFPSEAGFGKVPVWGFATVSESKCNDVETGDRFYGYFPMSSHLIVSPAKLSTGGFFDSKAHRSELSPIYNFYTRLAGDPGYVADLEEIQMLFRPLFTTSFLIDDFLADNAFYGAEQIILSSASSKTAYGLAFQLAKRKGLKVVGLTSLGNVDFVEKMNLYDQVVGYADIETINTSVKSVFVDMAGNGDVRARIHSHLNKMLAYSCSVGASHWDQMGANTDLAGPKPILFFAPSQAQKRSTDWGATGLQARIGEAWNSFVSQASEWVDVVEIEGKDAMLDIYQKTLEGSASPRNGYILKF